MRGRWLVKFGRWIARQETFEKMVAPAISDMQVEASCGRLHRWKHYVAIGLVLVHALFQDLCLDIESAFDGEARRLVWKRAAIWFGCAVAIFTILGLRYNLPQGLSLERIWRTALTSTLLEGVVTAMGIAVTVGIFYLHRKAVSRRSMVLVSLIAVALVIAVASGVRPIRISVDQILYGGVGHSSYYREARLDPQITWWKDIQSGVRVIPFAIFAVFLARRRGGLRVAAAFVCFLASWFLVVRSWMELMDALASRDPYQYLSPIMQGWRELALNLTLAVVWLALDSLLRRNRQLDRS